MKNKAILASGIIITFFSCGCASLHQQALSSDTTTRNKAISELRSGTEESKKEILCVAEVLRNASEVYSRTSAAVALGEVGPAAKDAAPALAKALSDSNSDVRQNASEALGKIGPASLPALVKALSESGIVGRQWAAVTLGKMGAVAQDAVPALAKALSDSDVYVRRYAAEALGKMRAVAQDAVPALAKALTDPDGAVCQNAVEALGKIGPASLLTLAKALSAPDVYVRLHAAEALGKMGVVGQDAVPALAKALTDPDAAVRRNVAEALGKMGAVGQDAAPALEKALSDSDSDVRQNAAKALGKIGPGAKHAVPRLMKLLVDSDMRLRQSANAALINIGVSQKAVDKYIQRIRQSLFSNAKQRVVDTGVLEYVFQHISLGRGAKAVYTVDLRVTSDIDSNVYVEVWLVRKEKWRYFLSLETGIPATQLADNWSREINFCSFTVTQSAITGDSRCANLMDLKTYQNALDKYHDKYYSDLENAR